MEEEEREQRKKKKYKWRGKRRRCKRRKGRRARIPGVGVALLRLHTPGRKTGGALFTVSDFHSSGGSLRLSRSDLRPTALIGSITLAEPRVLTSWRDCSLQPPRGAVGPLTSSSRRMPLWPHVSRSSRA